MITIKEIKQQAHSLNGCAKVDAMTTWEKVVNTLLSPQGREFAVKHSFPTLEMFRATKGLDKFDLFVDKGDMAFDGYDCVLVGDCNAEVNAVKNQCLHHIVLFYGAKARITTGGYAVVNITRIGNCDVEIINDGTAKVYYND